MHSPDAPQYDPSRPDRDTGTLKHVLLIDDNALQLQVRETILRSEGFHVSIATTAESAMASLWVLREQIGVVVTDHVMPGCSGSELVRQIRAVSPGLPIIVLSGMAEAEAEYQGLNVSFRAKPFPPPELIALVRAGMDQAERHQGAA